MEIYARCRDAHEARETEEPGAPTVDAQTGSLLRAAHELDAKRLADSWDEEA